MRARRTILIAVTLSFVVSESASAQDAVPTVESRTTGDRSELIETIPIPRGPGSFTTALALAPDEMPELRVGDEMRVSSELAITTDCVFSSPRCAGRPYEFDPIAQTELVLTQRGDELVLARDRRRCLQRLGNREHHCQIVFAGVELGASSGPIDCAFGGCALEVRIRAWNGRALGGEALVIGGNKPNGRIVQDKARLNVIRFRNGAERLAETVRGGPIRTRVPLDLNKRVIYSVRLDRLDAGDVLDVTVDARADVGHLPFPALVGSQLVLAEGPHEEHGRRFVKRVASLNGEITENNGTNCTQAKTPCPVHRTGVLRIRKDVRRQSGDPRPLWVNLVVRSTAKRADPAPGDSVRIENGAGLRVRQYAARG
ncbi:MAG: hypothetical protein WKF62_06025 [Solirubrobacterales bacterium]